MKLLDIINSIANRLKVLTKQNGVRTGEVRSVSAELYKTLANQHIDTILHHCTRLLDEKKWALDIVAYDWAYRVRSQYSETTFPVFERWVKEYLTDWSNCDDFCTHALGYFLSRYPEFFPSVLEWTQHPKFVVRRAAPVTLIYPIRKCQYQTMQPLLIADALMYDEHYLVLKGYGWMLKVLSQVDPDAVYGYLLKHKRTMPRTAFRYALEKFDSKLRAELMQ